MPEQFAIVAVYHYLDELSHAEIARSSAVPAGTSVTCSSD
jgi:DNA-directed RNA polymerase specialized sigma24 family protein